MLKVKLIWSKGQKHNGAEIQKKLMEIKEYTGRTIEVRIKHEK